MGSVCESVATSSVLGGYNGAINYSMWGSFWPDGALFSKGAKSKIMETSVLSSLGNEEGMAFEEGSNAGPESSAFGKSSESLRLAGGHLGNS